MKFEIFKYENVTSTNDVAINLIKEEKKEFGCVYASTQTKGRGTRGKKWVSDKGNLFSSIFFLLIITHYFICIFLFCVYAHISFFLFFHHYNPLHHNTLH